MRNHALAVICGVLGLCGSTQAGVIDALHTYSTYDNDDDGNGDKFMRMADNSIATTINAGSSGFSYERPHEHRGHVEFDLSSVTFTTITDATFHVPSPWYLGNGPIDLYYYQGNGIRDVGDYERTDSVAQLDLWSTNPSTSSTYNVHPIHQDVRSVLQDAMDEGWQHLGFTFVCPTYDANNPDSWATYGLYGSSVTVDFTGVNIPEPSTLAALASLALCGIGIGWRRRKA